VSRYYHRTSRAAADEILRVGFRDGHGRYLTESGHTGVWISDVPLDENEGADTLLVVEIGADLIEEFEWVEEGKPYREFLVPASVLNQLGMVGELLE
jgi:hypothetical protein